MFIEYCMPDADPGARDANNEKEEIVKGREGEEEGWEKQSQCRHSANITLFSPHDSPS